MNDKETIEHSIRQLGYIKTDLETVLHSMDGGTALLEQFGLNANLGTINMFRMFNGTVWYPVMSSVWICRGEWLDRSLDEWVAGIGEEFAELLYAIKDSHEHPWEWEAIQMCSILIRMLKAHGRYMPDGEIDVITRLMGELAKRMEQKGVVDHEND